MRMEVLAHRPAFLVVVVAGFVFSALVLQHCPAQADWLLWYPGVRLTYDGAASNLSRSGAKSVACDANGKIHIVWKDHRTGVSGVYHKVYDGTTWSADSLISDPASSAYRPAIAADDLGGIHVVWLDFREGDPEIYYKTFDGAAWSADQRITDGSDAPNNPAIASGTGQSLHVVWEDQVDYEEEIYYKTFDGSSWSEVERLTNNYGFSICASVDTDDSGGVYVVWTDTRDGDYEIYFNLFDGIAWGADTRLTSASGLSHDPMVKVDSAGICHVVWEDDRGGGSEIYYKYYEGGIWSADTCLTSSSGAATDPTVDSDGSGNLHLVWGDTRNGASDVYYKGRHGGVWGTDQNLSATTAVADRPSLAHTPGDSVHVIWQDERDGNREIYWSWSTGAGLGPVAVTSIEPSWGFHDHVVEITDLAGENFFRPVEVRLEKAGEPYIEATNVVIVSPQQITCTFDLAGTVPGYWNATVFNGDGRAASLVSGFEVRPWLKPVVTSITPAAGTSLDTLEVTDLAGDNFHAGAEVRLRKDGETDIVATDVAVVSDQKITCTMYLEGPDGIWDVVVENADGQSDTLIAGFLINPLPAPIIYSITPSEGEAQDTVEITDLAGENFCYGAEVRLQRAGEPDIVATDVVVSPEMITCTFLLDGVAGYWDVVVENADTKSDTLFSGFEIKPWPAPVVTAITPSFGYTAEIIHVRELAGEHFRSGLEVRLEAAGESDIVAEDVVVGSSQTATCRLVLPGGAEGTWDVVVENLDGLKDTLVSGFEIFTGAWSEDIRLTDAPYGSYMSRPNARCIAVDDVGNLHIVWYDYREGYNEIYYKKFDGTWNEDERLTFDAESSEYPSLAIDTGGNVHVVWCDHRDGHAEVYYKLHDGLGWGPDERLSNVDSAVVHPSRYPSIAADASGNLHVAWQEDDGDKIYIVYRQFNGAAWGPEETIASGHAYKIYPALAVDEYDNVHAVWQSLHYEAQYRKYDGVTWGPIQPLTGSDPTGAPSIAAGPDSCLHVVWNEHVWTGSDWVNEVFYKHFDGTSWGENLKLTGNPTDSQNASIVACDDGSLYVVWMDWRDGDWEIYWKRFDGSVWTGSYRLTFWPGESARPFAVVDGDGKLHVVWSDMRDGNREVYYKVRDPGVVSGVGNEAVWIEEPAALQVTPNPVTGGTEFRFALRDPVSASISIYDTAGRLVWQKDCRGLRPGMCSVRWDGRGSLGEVVASGVYFLRFGTGDTEATAKIVVLR